MEQKKDTKGVITWVFSLLRPHIKRLPVIILCFGLTTIIGFTQPQLIRIITDDGMTKSNIPVIVVAVCVLLALVIVDQCLELFQAGFFADIHNKAHLTIYHKAFRKLLRLKSDYFSDTSMTEMIDSMQMDVSRVTSITDRSTIQLISFAFKVISGIIGLLIISPQLTFIVLLMVPVKYLIVQRLSKKQEKKFDKLIGQHRVFAGWFGDVIGGIREIKLWGLHKREETTFIQQQNDILKTSKEQTMLMAVNSFWEMVLEWIITGILYVVGGIFISQETLTIGSVFAFVSYSGFVTAPIGAILNLRLSLAGILPSARRLKSFLELDEEPQDGRSVPEFHNIVFQDISFSYESKEIIRDVSFQIAKGEKVAIIGANGSGKSTLTHLLLRFLHPQKGKILLDDCDIQTCQIDQYRDQFAVVSQKPYLFFDTVKNNITLGEDFTDDEFWRACTLSGAKDFIDRLPQKENSKIGYDGARLSGGEKQKLTVARAIIKNAPVVIFDEATSGYDVESDAYLQKMIMTDLKEKSVLLITHRYESLTKMDKIYELKNGELALQD